MAEIVNKKTTVKRGKNGRFVKGTKPAHGGRKPVDHETRNILLAAAPDAARKLVEIIHDENTKDNTRLAAIKALMDRCFGKPAQAASTEQTQAEALNTLIQHLTKKDEGN